MSLTDDEVSRLEEILGAVQSEKLKGWDAKFMQNIEETYADKGADMHLTGKQWSQLNRIYANA